MKLKNLTFSVLMVFAAHYAHANEANANPNPYYNGEITPLDKASVSKKAKEIWNDKNFPISAKEVDEYIQKSSKIEKSFKPNINVQLSKKSININPTEAQNYPTVITSLGYNTVLTFWDLSGNPWDIEYVANGNETQFLIDQPSNVKYKNILIINPRELLAHTNITVSLKDEKNPITLQVMTNDLTGDLNKAYGEVSINLKKRNPSSPLPPAQIDTSLTQSAEDSNVLLAFIDGLPPKGAIPIKIKNQDSDIKAWVYQDEFYIKTPHALVWPPSKSIQRDGSNAAVYKTAKSPLLRIDNLETGITKNYEVEDVE
jgi:hypothetical protein